MVTREVAEPAGKVDGALSGFGAHAWTARESGSSSRLTQADPAKLAEEIASLREQQRAYRRGLGPHVEDMHAAVDALVADAQATFASAFADHRFARDLRNPSIPGLADAFIVRQRGVREAAHGAVDQAARDGRFDVTKRSEINDRLEQFRVDIASRSWRSNVESRRRVP
jgi:hypothetical protein